MLGANGVRIFWAAVFSASLLATASASPLNFEGASDLPIKSVTNARITEALAKPRSIRPAQFAVSIPFPIKLSDGTWSSVDTRTSVWRTRIKSSGARSLSLEFGKFKLPVGARLWVYDPTGRYVQGPYDRRNENGLGKFWTASVPGDELIVELQTSSDKRADVQLEILNLMHGFARLNDDVMPKAGGCNINAACPEGDAWRNEIRSVAQITIAGQFFCTGQLVNNVRQDSRPLFLTANHCGIGTPARPAESLVFYWNFQSSQCGSNSNANMDQNQSGATLLARDAESDFSLVELSQPPSPTFNVYFAGWNNAANAPQSGISVHHPLGDRNVPDSHKRLAVYNTPAAATDVFVEGQLVHAWQVQWSKGVTEQGSSGSGLWDQNRHLVGVLSGGDSSCENPGGSDYYGRLDDAWTANPTADGQLKAHLDPDNTGRIALPGRDSARQTTEVMDGEAGSGVLLGGALDGFLVSLLGLLGLRHARCA